MSSSRRFYFVRLHFYSSRWIRLIQITFEWRKCSNTFGHIIGDQSLSLGHFYIFLNRLCEVFSMDNVECNAYSDKNAHKYSSGQSIFSCSLVPSHSPSHTPSTTLNVSDISREKKVQSPEPNAHIGIVSIASLLSADAIFGAKLLLPKQVQLECYCYLVARWDSHL